MHSFHIYRRDPDRDEAPRMQVFELEVAAGERMLLDVLMRLKAIDPRLSFRRSCREGICGSDAMNINGKNGLACTTNMRALPGKVVLKPLPGLPVIRDLIVDMTQFFKQYHSIKPYLVNDGINYNLRFTIHDFKSKIQNHKSYCAVCQLRGLT